MSGVDRTNEFTDLLTAHQNSLFAYIYALVRNLRDTEDIYQEVAFTLWQKFDAYQSDTNFAAWARATALFKVRDFLRSKRRSRVFFDDQLMSELADTSAKLQVAATSDTPDAYHFALVDCMNGLNAADQQLVALSYSGNCSLQEVAKQEGRSPQSVCNSLKRIRGALLDCIEQKIHEDRR